METKEKLINDIAAFIDRKIDYGISNASGIEDNARDFLINLVAHIDMLQADTKRQQEWFGDTFKAEMLINEGYQLALFVIKDYLKESGIMGFLEGE